MDTGARRGASGICIRWKRPHLHETRGSRHGLSGLGSPRPDGGECGKNRRAVSRRRHGDAGRGREGEKGRQLRGPQAAAGPRRGGGGGSLRIHLGRQTGRHGRGRPPHLQNPPPREGGQPGLGHHPEPLHRGRQSGSAENPPGELSGRGEGDLPGPALQHRQRFHLSGFLCDGPRRISRCQRIPGRGGEDQLSAEKHVFGRQVSLRLVLHALFQTAAGPQPALPGRRHPDLHRRP